MVLPLRLVAAVVLVVAAAPLAIERPGAQAGPSRAYTMPPPIGDGWPTMTAERAGVDPARLGAMTTAIRERPELNIHAVLIERDGYLVYEEYFAGPDERWGRPLGLVTVTRRSLHDLRSVTKSVVSALVGLAVESGDIPSLDAPLVDFFPEYADLQTAERRRMTIRHALTMTSGLEWNEDVPYNDPANDEIVMGHSREPLRYALGRPFAAAPGSAWRYNGGMTQVLGTIVQRASGQPLADYARSKLFWPLDIRGFEWMGSLGGVPSAASGLRLRPRDLARFGSLYLHEGKWQKRQVLPRAWVEESTRRRLTFPGQQARGYAYQWWHTCHETPAGMVEVPTAVGNGGQRIFVLRAQRAVVTVLAGRYNDFGSDPPERLLLDYIIPALQAGTRSGCPS